MGRKKKDNPIVMVVMGVILLAALVSVGRSLFGGGPAPGVRVASASTQEAAEASRSEVGVLPVSERDPFSSSMLHAPKSPIIGTASQSGPRLETGPLFLRPVTPIKFPRSEPINSAPTLMPTGRTARSENGVPFYPAAGGQERTVDESTLVKSLRVTAIIVGSNSYAVVEPAGKPPRTLHLDSTYVTLKVVTIRASEIVLKGQTGLWTLPLSTPDSEGAPGRAESPKG